MWKCQVSTLNFDCPTFHWASSSLCWVSNTLLCTEQKQPQVWAGLADGNCTELFCFWFREPVTPLARGLCACNHDCSIAARELHFHALNRGCGCVCVGVCVCVFFWAKKAISRGRAFQWKEILDLVGVCTLLEWCQRYPSRENTWSVRNRHSEWQKVAYDNYYCFVSES